MDTNRLPPLLISLGAAMWPMLALAQPSAESADVGLSTAAQAGPPDTSMSRSPLWQAVDAMHRQRDGAAAEERRLNSEQRQQLRDQIRRAALRPDAEAPVRGTHLGQR
ncbi:hypothetical protein [Ottowia testudinis]|uniref:DUF4148 domain-containing protein n=1 Tax=Ottowia testudinis TaxID=2816950 RepID=A0A975CE09_9BURK|nr:hypothetical protein [Ottowia testudinis]QTD44675.1 hypothetical protein J1M35_16530 [Ottowia testudinis]